jgi:hypothetical protein
MSQLSSVALAVACVVTAGAWRPDPAVGRRPLVARPRGATPVAPAAGADSAVEFRLRDQFGRVHEAAAYRGRALLLVGAGRGGRVAGTAWVSTFRDLQGDPAAAAAVVVPVVAVADLRGVPRLLRRFARGQFPRDPQQVVLLDWDGALARRLAFDADRCTVLLVGPAGQVLARSTPGAVDTAAARLLLRQAGDVPPTPVPVADAVSGR